MNEKKTQKLILLYNLLGLIYFNVVAIFIACNYQGLLDKNYWMDTLSLNESVNRIIFAIILVAVAKVWIYTLHLFGLSTSEMKNQLKVGKRCVLLACITLCLFFACILFLFQRLE
ncbi:MAG: hypothetical protein Q4C70_01985 [Planctomycetia bacterium]|nr:hypothetical protein [Planctomycetia bacterium]